MTVKKQPSNGNIKNLKAIEDVKINFPVTYDLKVVFDTTVSDDEIRKNLSDAFGRLNVTNSYKGNKKSSKGTYMSYNFEVTLKNKEQLDKLYSDLKDLPGIKFAL